VDDAFDSVCLGSLENKTGTGDIGGVNFFGGVEREGSGSVDDNISIFHTVSEIGFAADITLKEGDFVVFRVGEINQVDTADVIVAVLEEESYQVDAQETADAGNVDFHNFSL